MSTPSLDPADGRNIAHGAMSGGSVDVGAAPDFPNLFIWDAFQDDGQANVPSPCPSSDGACRKRVYEQECPYRKGEVAGRESPMFRFVEYFPEYHQPYIGDSYGNQVFICADEAKACSGRCACRVLESQSNHFAFVTTKTSAGLSINFCDSALRGVVAAAISGEPDILNGAGALTAGATFDGLDVLAQHARLKRHLELLDPSHPVVPALSLLVNGFLEDGDVFKSFGYIDLFERGYLSLDLWREFQHRQLDDDITLLDKSFSAVAEDRSQGSFGDVNLVRAAEAGDESAVRLLLDRGADVNHTVFLKSPLQAAANGGHESVVRLLLDRGADINPQVLSKTPLEAAAEGGHESVIRLLLDRGADVNHGGFSRSPLRAAAERGHESVVRLLLDRGADVNPRRPSKSPLEAAAKGGHETVVQLLLDRGARPRKKAKPEHDHTYRGSLEDGYNKTALSLSKLLWGCGTFGLPSKIGTPTDSVASSWWASWTSLSDDFWTQSSDDFWTQASNDFFTDRDRRPTLNTEDSYYESSLRSPRDQAPVVRKLREVRETKKAAKRRSEAYMATCYDAFVQDYGRVTDVARPKRNQPVVQFNGHGENSRRCEFNESVFNRFATLRAAWHSGIRTLRRVSKGELPKDPGEVFAFLCVCSALSRTLDFFTESEYGTLFLADLRRWGLLFENSLDCYSDLIRGVWGVDITNEPLLSPSAGDLLDYAQGLVSSVVGAASGLVRPMAWGAGHRLEESQQRWLEGHATRIDFDNDMLGSVSRKPPDESVPEAPWLREQILHDVSSAHTSVTLVILMSGAIFAIILIFLLWLRTTSIRGIQAAPMCPSLRRSSLPVGGILPLVQSCMVLETYLGLRSKAHEFEPGWAAWNLDTISPPECRAPSSSSPSQSAVVPDSANGLADVESSVAQKSTSVFSARTRKPGRRKSWFCDDCRQPFASSSNYWRHWREQHGKQPGVKVICPNCRKSLSRPDYLAKHLARNKCRNR